MSNGGTKQRKLKWKAIPTERESCCSNSSKFYTVFAMIQTGTAFSLSLPSNNWQQQTIVDGGGNKTNVVTFQISVFT